MNSIRVLVVGLGSIGQRHLSNLRRLGIIDITVYRALNRPLQTPGLLEDVMIFNNLEEALSRDQDAVIICNPTSLHIPVALEAARAGCHLLIEKPISNSVEGIRELAAIVQEKSLHVLVGFQFRFNPGLKTIKRLLVEKSIGHVIDVHIHWGEYLPTWHPWEDYRNGYSSRSELGGGVIFTLTHPFDYIRWLVGEIKSVAAMAGHLSKLEIDVEDTSNILMEFESGSFGSIHLDYIQSPGTHHLQIVGEEGTIWWNNMNGTVTMLRRDQTEKIFPAPTGFERNQMFLEEMRHFLSCLIGSAKPLVNLEDGIRTLAIALAARQSAKERRTVEVKDVWTT